MSFGEMARDWACVASVLALAACAGSQPPVETPDVALNWPELRGSELPPVGGGESDAVVIIAIEQYAQLPPVEGARRSAADWFDYFTRDLRVPVARVRLEQEHVTASTMRAAVEKARAQVRGRGRLWVVFIGHGAAVLHEPSDGWLLDSLAGRTAPTGLKHSELLQLVKRAGKARRGPVLVLDACCSGDVASPHVITFSATQRGQRAHPLPGAAEPRRAFSYLLAGGLRGWADAAGDADGAVTPEEAIGFTRNVLERLGRDQTPRLRGRASVPLVRAADLPPLDVTFGRAGSSTP